MMRLVKVEKNGIIKKKKKKILGKIGQIFNLKH